MTTRLLTRALLAAIFIAPLLPAAAAAQTLRGSMTSVVNQNRVALDHDFTFLRTAADVSRFTKAGYLVPVSGNRHYELIGVSFPYARPAVRTFIERLSAQYRSACGENLVVTSLTRPANKQPRNASSESVHPAGMAVDLRVSSKRACRVWLESTLLSLEKQGLLDATREQRPPHYHIAIFPTAYTEYVDRINGTTTTVTTESSEGSATQR